MSFPEPRGSRLGLWLLVHGLILLGVFLIREKQINTSLYSLLPEFRSEEYLGAEEAYTASLGESLTILVGAETFEDARSRAEEFSRELLDVPGIRDIQFEMDSQRLEKFRRYLYRNRYQFLSGETRALLKKKDIQALRESAFMNLYSPVSTGSLDYLGEDPFLLTSSHLGEFLTRVLNGSTSLALRDSVLYRQTEGLYWVLISLRCGPEGEIELESSPAAKIFDIRKSLVSTYPDVRVILSGGAFHSYLESMNSQKEIRVLSTVSSLFILLLLLIVFRSFLPLLMTLFSIVTGVLAGLGMTIILFREIHVFTVVFGTSLIGISVDYAFHFFSEWAQSGNSSDSVLKKVGKGIFLGLLTTGVSYGAFIFTGFPLLQQMAVFSICGLSSSFATVHCIFPLAGKAKASSVSGTQKRIQFLVRLQAGASLFEKGKGLYFLCLAGMILLFTGLYNMKLSSSLGDLYKMPENLRMWEEASARIINHQASAEHFIVAADSLEALLQKEEDLLVQLEEMKINSSVKDVRALAEFLPSRKSQDEDFCLVKENLAPELPAQMDALGFEPVFSFPSRRLQLDYMDLEEFGQLGLASLFSALYIGKIHGKVYGALPLFGVRDDQALQELAQHYEGVFYVDKVAGIEATLLYLSRLMLGILGLSYLFIAGGLFFRYSPKAVLFITGLPLISSLLTLSILNLLSVPISIFVVVGLILVPGMGSDYLILLFESRGDASSALLSVSLSFLTTLLAFGMLGFTSIASSFGITVGLGIFLTYMFVLMLRFPCQASGTVHGKI